jgi:hypothetical protein
VNGRFSIFIDANKVFGQEKNMAAFAEIKEIKQIVRDVVGRVKPLGHTDTTCSSSIHNICWGRYTLWWLKVPGMGSEKGPAGCLEAKTWAQTAFDKLSYIKYPHKNLNQQASAGWHM